MKRLGLLLSIFLLTGCAISQKIGQLSGVEHTPKLAENKMQKEFDTVPPPEGKRLTVAVYGFADKTGQRKPTAGVASLSTAVTQGGETFLIKALQDVSGGEWFEVVERVGIDNIVKERTIIKQMREAYEGPQAKPLMPLTFAGIIMDGGIIGYDSGSESGGIAYRWLGIGPSTQYSKDTVTISLRAISVNTGKVLAAVTVTKVVYSTADSVAALKFFRDGTQAFEFESGLTINEPGTIAVKTTIEAAVVELIREGQRKGIWDYRKPPPIVVAPVVEPVAPVEEKKPEPEKSEPKKAVITKPKKEVKVQVREINLRPKANEEAK